VVAPRDTIAAAHRLRRALLALAVPALTLGALLLGAVALPASASALPSPVALDAPNNGGPPLMAYAPITQTTYVAWANGQGTGVDLCVLPPGGTSCEGGGPVLLLDPSYPGISGSNTLGLGGLDVLPNGDVVVIGTPVEEGSVAWESAPGGASFLSGGQGLQDGGGFISPVSLFYAFGNTVALSDSDVALLDSYGGQFSDSPFSTPSPTPPASANPTSGLYPGKSLWADGSEVGAMAAPAPAAPGTDIVVGAGDDFGSGSTVPGCSNNAATGFGVSSGKVDGASRASGTLNREGLPDYSLLACSAEAPVVASGASGIGVLEEEGSGVSGAGSDWQVDYRPFDATATGGSFGAPVELQDTTSQALDGVDTIAVSEDNGTGVYGSWDDLQGLVLDYSANGGATWGGAAVVPAQPSGSYGDQVIAGVGGGNAEIAYEANTGAGEQVFVLPVDYAAIVAYDAPSSTPPPPAPVPAPDTLSTSQTSGPGNTGASIQISAGTVGEVDRAAVVGANAPIATGTVSYTLYSSATCAVGSAVFTSAPEGVTAGVAAPSSPVTSSLSPGKYYWTAAYSGDANNVASSSPCGSEILSVSPAVALPGTGSSTSTTLTITITCAVTPCTVTVTITVPGASAASARKRKPPKPLVLFTGKLSIKKVGPNSLTLHLTKVGKALVAKDHGHLRADLLVSDQTPGGPILTSREVSFAPAKGHHKAK
jgi:hypothetical protein